MILSGLVNQSTVTRNFFSACFTTQLCPSAQVTLTTRFETPPLSLSNETGSPRLAYRFR